MPTGYGELSPGQGTYLGKAYPNPFTNKTEIPYVLGTDSKVKLNVYDGLVQEKCILVDQYQEAGNYKAEFERGVLHSGIYYYKFEVRNNKGVRVKVGKLIITTR